MIRAFTSRIGYNHTRWRNPHETRYRAKQHAGPRFLWIVQYLLVFNDTQTHKLRPAYLKSLGVSALIIKGLGLTAYELLNQNGITVYACDPIPVDEALALYLTQALEVMDAPEGAHC